MKRFFAVLGFWLWSTMAFANVPCTLPFTLVNGTTADASQVMANYNALVSCLGNAALAGANADITSLSALTTPIAPVAGGTFLFSAGTSSGSANAQTIASTIPANFSLTNNYTVIFKAGFTNTGATTLNVNATGAIAVLKQSGAGLVALQGGEIVSGQVVEARYDGTQYELVTSQLRVVGGSLPVIGSTTNFYNPTNALSVASTGQTLKTTRLQVDLEALQGTQGGTQSPASWVPNFYAGGNVNVFADIAVTSTIGGFPISGSTRTSDFRTAFGGTSNGSGSYFLAVNDDTTGAPIASALVSTAWRQSGVAGITESNQVDVDNAGTVVDSTALSPTPAGSTIGLNITAGAESNTLNNASAALIIGPGLNARFRRGMICEINALDTAVGNGGQGICLEMGRQESIRWLNASNGVDAEITGSAVGFQLFPNMVLNKITASGTAPGAAFMKFEAVAGTNAGTCKLIAYAGTSATAVTIVDNVGAGC